ncbi:MAG: squalene--hopene cyclase [Methylophilaceae bacterium]|nr:squalene--hopene cyclase [Methylophilaceae bacterium]
MQTKVDEQLHISVGEAHASSVAALTGLSKTTPFEELDSALVCAREAIISRQSLQGYWVFDLEADATIPAEYILLQHYLGTVELELQTRIAHYLRRKQQSNGGWPIFEEGASDISATVKAYFALKVAGDLPDEPHMKKARELILSMGGAAKVNVFTRTTLALFGQLPWRTVVAMPIEIMLLPKWFFFHLSKVSYWSRCVMTPLLILFNRQPVHTLPAEHCVTELFTSPPQNLRHLDHFIPGRYLHNAFILLDSVLRFVDPLMPQKLRGRALRRADVWVREHMQGEGGIGGIFPAMANALMALKALGYDDNHPDMVRGTKAVNDLIVEQADEAYCQACVSPVWDTCLTINALIEAGVPESHPAIKSSVAWLLKEQIFTRGDWCDLAPDLAPGGWAFQFENAQFPDVDDTCVVLMALLRAGAHRNPHTLTEHIQPAVNWVLGMQSSDGSWGAFDINNNRLYLNNIPFADHGALLDPGTADLTARCIELLSMLGYNRHFPPIERGLAFVRKEQEENGAWFGRWGVNYIYGTWSVLCALNALGEDVGQPYIRKSVIWLNSCQNEDGGWGETCDSYDDAKLAGVGKSTASQTAWALLGLMAAGEVNSNSVKRGIQYLVSSLNADGQWEEHLYTGTGFPKVFYLLYHGYSQYFPLWALGVYQSLRNGDSTRQMSGLAAEPLLGTLPAQLAARKVNTRRAFS